MNLIKTTFAALTLAASSAALAAPITVQFDNVSGTTYYDTINGGSLTFNTSAGIDVKVSGQYSDSNGTGGQLAHSSLGLGVKGIGGAAFHKEINSFVGVDELVNFGFWDTARGAWADVKLTSIEFRQVDGLSIDRYSVDLTDNNGGVTSQSGPITASFGSFQRVNVSFNQTGRFFDVSADYTGWNPSSFTISAITFEKIVTTVDVPEPASLALLGLGLAGLGISRRKKA